MTISFILAALLVLALTSTVVHGSSIEIDIYYPEDNLDNDFITAFTPSGTVFGVSITTCQTEQNTTECPGGEQAFMPDLYSINNNTDGSS